MPIIIFEQPDGVAAEVDVPVGQSLMRAAIEHGIHGIEAECGGACACATCHVYVEDGAPFAPPEEMEKDMLEGVAADRAPTSRLSCQLEMKPEFEGLRVRIPATQY